MKDPMNKNMSCEADERALGCRPLRGLETFFLIFSWGLRPRLYAVTCFAG